MNVKIKRVYEKPSKEDGIRILVDRLWPRGLTMEGARIDLWLRDFAPSTALRKWFNHDPGKWSEFKERYRQELEQNRDHILFMKEHAGEGAITLLYGARDEKHNQAIVLKEVFAEGYLK